jgi:hypothetical protein
MGGMGWEPVIVGLLVAGAGAWAVRALLRSLKKPGGCSSCASGGSCPVVKGGAEGAADCGSAPGEAPPRRGNVALH